MSGNWIYILGPGQSVNSRLDANSEDCSCVVPRETIRLTSFDAITNVAFPVNTQQDRRRRDSKSCRSPLPFPEQLQCRYSMTYVPFCRKPFLVRVRSYMGFVVVDLDKDWSV